ncbi:MAG: hypothetical protein D4R88_07130 [Methanosarcinales archaeon]|nr:MAG: hypothetical protein D4R88_07130 [Methanosarcinales archaeon]
MVKSKEKFGEVSKESIITTIEIAKKLEKEDKFFVHPYPGAMAYGLSETEPLVIDGTEQDSETFLNNMKIVHYVAYHVLSGTVEEIDKKINTEIIDAVRNKYIDETYRDKFYVGSTSNSYVFLGIDYSFGKKFSISEMAIVPPAPYLILSLNLIDSLTGERKKIPIEVDFSTLLSITKQLDEISQNAKNFK